MIFIDISCISTERYFVWFTNHFSHPDTFWSWLPAVINNQGCVQHLDRKHNYVLHLGHWLMKTNTSHVLSVNRTSNLVCFLYCLMKNGAVPSNCSLLLLCWSLNTYSTASCPSITVTWMCCALVNDTDSNKLVIFSGIAWYYGGNLSCKLNKTF